MPGSRLRTRLELLINANGGTVLAPGRRTPEQAGKLVAFWNTPGTTPWEAVDAAKELGVTSKTRMSPEEDGAGARYEVVFRWNEDTT